MAAVPALQGPGSWGLTQAQKAGIGVGAGVGGLLLAVGGVRLLRRYRAKGGAGRKKVSSRVHAGSPAAGWPSMHACSTSASVAAMCIMPLSLPGGDCRVLELPHSIIMSLRVTTSSVALHSSSACMRWLPHVASFASPAGVSAWG